MSLQGSSYLTQRQNIIQIGFHSSIQLGREGAALTLVCQPHFCPGPLTQNPFQEKGLLSSSGNGSLCLSQGPRRVHTMTILLRKAYHFFGLGQLLPGEVFSLGPGFSETWHSQLCPLGASDLWGDPTGSSFLVSSPETFFPHLLSPWVFSSLSLYNPLKGPGIPSLINYSPDTQAINYPKMDICWLILFSRARYKYAESLKGPATLWHCCLHYISMAGKIAICMPQNFRVMN